MIRLLIAFILLSLPCKSDCQEGITSLAENGLNYKKAIKLASEVQKPVLAVIYNPNLPFTSHSFQNIEQIIESAGCIGVAINYEKDYRKKPLKNIVNYNNPTWALIHPNEVIIQVSTLITDEASLNEFINKGKPTFDKMYNTLRKIENSRKLSDQVDYVRAISATYNTKHTSQILDNLIKEVNTNKISDEALKSIFSLGYSCPYSKRLNRLITKDYEKAKNLIGRDSILYIQERYILDELNKRNKLRPYNLWKRLEKETGDGADSLYRIFALTYFSRPLIFDKEALYHEAFEYLQFYPNSSWKYLEPLYAIVTPQTFEKRDLEILIDLISFQISREESYEKLDYKAVLLYKLGEKEKGLSMIKHINSDALKKGIRYKSMLYALSKN